MSRMDGKKTHTHTLRADGPQRRARLPIPHTCNVTILPVVTADLPMPPRFSPAVFDRDASLALLHFVNAFRYGSQYCITVGFSPTFLYVAPKVTTVIIGESGCNSIIITTMCRARALMVYYIVCFVFTVFLVSLHGD